MCILPNVGHFLIFAKLHHSKFQPPENTHNTILTVKSVSTEFANFTIMRWTKICSLTHDGVEYFCLQWILLWICDLLKRQKSKIDLVVYVVDAWTAQYPCSLYQIITVDSGFHGDVFSPQMSRFPSLLPGPVRRELGSADQYWGKLHMFSGRVQVFLYLSPKWVLVSHLMGFHVDDVSLFWRGRQLFLMTSNEWSGALSGAHQFGVKVLLFLTSTETDVKTTEQLAPEVV